MRFYVWFLALHITLFYHKKNIFLVLKKEYRPAFYLDAIKKECRHAFWGHRLGQAPLSGPKKGMRHSSLLSVFSKNKYLQALLVLEFLFHQFPGKEFHAGIHFDHQLLF